MFNCINSVKILPDLTDLALKVWDETHPAQKKEIFHYSSADGLMGMISANSIWASSFETMNDKKELRDGFELLRHLATQSLERFFPASSALACLKQNFNDFLAKEKIRPGIRPYIASFTPSSDNEYHWSNYANNSKGGAISFNIDFKPKPTQLWRFGQVLYEETKLKSNFDSDLKRLFTSFQESVKKIDKQYQKEFINNLLIAIVMLMFLHSSMFKRLCWSIEEEWRVVTFDTIGPIQYRVRDGNLVDFLEIPFGNINLSINGIKLGPCATNESTWKMFMKAQGLGVNYFLGKAGSETPPEAQ